MADDYAVRESRREEQSPSADQSSAKTARDFEKCTFCRKERKRCVSVERQFRCKRCIEKRRTCGPRQRMHPRPENLQARDEYLATSIAGSTLLSTIVRQSNLKLSTTLYPFPYFTLKCHGAFSRSPALRDAHELVASRTQVQTYLIGQLIDKLNHGMLSIWNQIDVSDFRHTVYFHPSQVALEPASSLHHAEIIATGVQYVPQACETQFQMFHVDIKYRIGWYRKIESNLQNLLQRDFFSVTGMAQPLVLICQGIPASIIAYLNGDKPAAFELWTQASGALDLLGRTLAHVVVEQGDCEFLEQMAIRNLQGLDCGCDARGLTLLAIATYTGCDRCFDIMLDTHRTIQLQNIEYRWLDLALASGSAYIVSKILELGLTLPPYQRDIEIAIQLGRADMTKFMVQWLFDRCYNSRDEVERLRQLAKEQVVLLQQEWANAESQGQDWNCRAECLKERLQHMNNLVVRLEVRQAVDPNPKDAMKSLQALAHKRRI